MGKAKAKPKAKVERRVPSGDGWIGVIVFLLLAGMIVLLSALMREPMGYVVTLVGVLFFIIGIGGFTAGNGAALLVDERNRLSLSRVQFCLWFLVLLSGYVSLSIGRLKLGGAGSDAGPVEMPYSLWIISGLSGFSLVASSWIRCVKERRALPETAARPAGARGLLVTKPKMTDAAFGDLLLGEEVGNHDRVDLSRVQLLIFTAIVAAFFMADLIRGLPTNPALPPAPTGLWVLMAVSHLVYLGHKLSDHLDG